MRNKWFKRFSIATAVVCTPCLLPWFLFDVKPYHAPDLFVRSLRTFSAGLLITLDYKKLPEEDEMDHTSEEYKFLVAQVHERTANRILSVCRANKGIYTKAGQHIS